ncbi:MAG: flagellar hook-basal body complex protein FliE [Gluconacetobacter diazotrophicus]|nr:flagellar hook-basal body complex protein FliE [Gluconacetobacter diazotrophicus]
MGASPAEAFGAYARVQNANGAGAAVAGDGMTDAAAAGGSFGDVLGRAVQGVIDTGHAADAAAARGIAGKGDLTQVVMAVSQAQLALQSTTAIRDRVVQAYQDVMKMAI